MEIKGEANVFKYEFAKNLKQLAKKISVALIKKDNTTKIVIENKHTTNITVNFVTVGQLTPAQTKEVTERTSQLFKEQAGVIEASGDKVFNYLVSQSIPIATASTGTATALLIRNADYLIEGGGHPIFIRDFKNLPCSIQISPEKPPSGKNKIV